MMTVDDQREARTVAIIPARGGSKGIPRKNAKPLAGRPLVAHTIECARRAKTVDLVAVSTDDAEIAEIAGRFGAKVIERPAELAGDAASSESALTHALDVLAGEGIVPDRVLMLQCTSPLTTPADIDGAVDRLEAERADSCFTAVAFKHFVWDVDASGAARGVNHDGGPRKRRQDLDRQLLENGAVYVMDRERYLAERTRFCGRTVIHEVSASTVLEIDDPIDWVKAEAAVRHVARTGAAEGLPNPPAAIIFDFDGVFTDNAVFVLEDGREAVRCDRGDGMGLGFLKTEGIPLLILSKEKNPVVQARARKLQLECIHGQDRKWHVLEGWLQDRNLDPEDVIFVGNDVNDLECMRGVGFSVCPADAHPEARAVARLVLTSPGGRGAVRELCDLILERLHGRPT